MVKDVEMPTRFLGYNAEQVDKYLEDLNKAHLDEIVEIKQEVERLYQEKGEYYERLVDLKLEKAQMTKNLEMLEFALKRARETAAVLEKLGQQDADSIIEKAKIENAQYFRRTEEVEQEIKATKMWIESLLENMRSLIKESEAAKMESQGQSKVVGKILPVSDRIRLAVSETAKSSTGEGLEHSPKDKGSEDTKNGLWIPDAQKMTADGAVAGNNCREQAKNARPAALTAGEQVRERSPDMRISKDSYWEEDAEPLIRKETVHEQTMPAKRGAVTPREEGTFSAPAISNEINRNRHKYIVGKIAGEDIYDAAGQRIIAKNETITPEVVKKAEEEGKLPELIINMILPGMEQ